MVRAGVPALQVQVWRGDLVESEHQVHAAVCDADGALFRAWGDPQRVAYPRSALKPLQAFPLVATGAAAALGLTDCEVAIACGSHSGQAFHLAAVRSLLARAGLGEDALQCGAHRPIHLPEADALIRAGLDPQPAHNNCSGKHAGMLALARSLGAPTETYLDRAHPAQRAIVAAISRLSGVSEEAIAAGVDGCGAPTFALPLRGTATAFARLAAARTGSAEGDAAARRIAAAMMACPEMVGGTGRFDTVLMQAMPGVLFCKSGAEGFLCAGIPASGLGLALKVADGAGRAVPSAALHCLRELGVLSHPLPGELVPWEEAAVTNVSGRVVGRMVAVVGA